MPMDHKDFDAARFLIYDIEALEHRAHRLGMVLSAHALNEAKNKSGWELAEEMQAHQRQLLGSQ